MGKLKKRFIIASMGMAILLMTFGSFGSFYPFDVGFYTSIGIVWFYFSFYGFKWFLAKK